MGQKFGHPSYFRLSEFLMSVICKCELMLRSDFYIKLLHKFYPYTIISIMIFMLLHQVFLTLDVFLKLFPKTKCVGKCNPKFKNDKPYLDLPNELSPKRNCVLVKINRIHTIAFCY